MLFTWPSVLFPAVLMLGGVMASLNSNPCTSSIPKLKASCLSTVKRISPSFTTSAQSFIFGSSPTIPSPSAVLNDTLGEATFAYCKAAFTFIDCLSKGLCLSANCTAEEASAGITTARASIGAWFTSHPVCPVVGNLNLDTGCGNVTSFRRLNGECQAKMAPLLRTQTAASCPLYSDDSIALDCLGVNQTGLLCQKAALCAVTCDSTVVKLRLIYILYQIKALHSLHCPTKYFPTQITCRATDPNYQMVNLSSVTELPSSSFSPLNIFLILFDTLLLIAGLALAIYYWILKKKPSVSLAKEESAKRDEKGVQKGDQKVDKKKIASKSAVPILSALEAVKSSAKIGKSAKK